MGGAGPWLTVAAMSRLVAALAASCGIVSKVCSVVLHTSDKPPVAVCSGTVVRVDGGLS